MYRNRAFPISYIKETCFQKVLQLILPTLYFATHLVHFNLKNGLEKVLVFAASNSVIKKQKSLSTIHSATVYFSKNWVKMAGFTYHTKFSQGSRISKNIYLSMITYYHPFLFQLLNNKFEICCKCSQAVDWLIWRIQSAVFCTALQKLFWKMSPDKDLIEKSPIGCLWGSIQMLKENNSRSKVDKFLSELNFEWIAQALARKF